MPSVRVNRQLRSFDEPKTKPMPPATLQVKDPDIGAGLAGRLRRAGCGRGLGVCVAQRAHEQRWRRLPPANIVRNIDILR